VCRGQGLALPAPAAAQSAERYEGPIIDVHMHAYTDDDYWGAVPHPATGEPAPATDEEHLERTLEVMDEHGVVLGAVSGDALAAAEAWADRAPDRFLKGIAVHDPVEDLDADEFAGWVEAGRLEVFAEIGAQYGGYSPSDPAFDPYWSVAEDHGIPVGIHTGESFPGTPYDDCCPDFRLRLGDPLLLEEMLVAHPDLKVFVMHAGGWFWERALQLMQMYPQVHAEVGVLGHVPEHRATETLERFLRGAKARGYLDRVMFGSDQMVWPEAIALSVEAVQSLDFLTVEEKGAIFYDNAARFLGLSEEERAAHHGR
jgi:predicted TIM-barrel fold metal-dependent hydrolase